MQTLTVPSGKISDLFSAPKDREGRRFRLMRYVIRCEREGRILLHNAVTGQTVLAEQKEAVCLRGLPACYDETMEQLVDAHFLVPEDYDEYRQVVNLRNILRKLYSIRPVPITFFTILPTMACNAGCWYCYEKGRIPVTMTEQTADETADFIRRSCNGKKVTITWYGGEPTVAAGRIDRICERLRAGGTEYQSNMITNGYLFDSEMTDRAVRLWHLKLVQISVDGTEERYNRIKAFKGAEDNPYQRVMRNAGLLLQAGIAVRMRLNFDRDNVRDFPGLAKEARLRFGTNPLFHLYASPVMIMDGGGGAQEMTPEVRGASELHPGGDPDWISRTIVSLNDLSRREGLYHRKERLPSLRFRGCEADLDSAVVINARGELARCCEMPEGECVTGNVKDGILDREKYRSWNTLADMKKCSACTFFPACVKMEMCHTKNHCFLEDRNREYIRIAEKLLDQV